MSEGRKPLSVDIGGFLRATCGFSVEFLGQSGKLRGFIVVLMEKENSLGSKKVDAHQLGGLFKFSYTS